ncbi:MAG TPA: SHOCT domain-containing protein [Candidatus Nanopelagicales bacterium]
MAYRFNPPPGWDVPSGFSPGEGWAPDPTWPAAPEGWEFWLAEPVAPPPPPGPAASATAGATAKMSGMFKTLKAKAQEDDWAGKAKAAATQAAATAQQAAGQATTAAKQRDQSTLDQAGPMPDGALWRGVSHEAGRNAVVTLYRDRIERVKATSKLSLTGMLTGGAQDVEVIPMKSVSSVQVRRGSWYHDVTVYCSGNTIVLSMDAADAERLRSLVMEQVLGGSPSGAPASPPAPAPAPATGPAPAPGGDDVVARIRQLGELRDAGLLTDEEFEAKKADLLGRL